MTGDTVEVHLLGFPLELYQRAQEHTDELLREFQLMAQGAASGEPTVPHRLVRLVEDLTAEYAAVGEVPDATRDAAVAAGRREVDLVYVVPVGVMDAARDLNGMLDEADEFCKQGRHLLTLASPPEVVRFRHWYLDQFVDQVAGKPPVAWPDYAR